MKIAAALLTITGIMLLPQYNNDHIIADFILITIALAIIYEDLMHR